MFKDIYSGIRKDKHRRMKYLVSCILVVFLAITTITLVFSPVGLIPTTQAEETPETNENTQFPQIGDPSELYPDSNVYSLDFSGTYDSGVYSAEFPSQDNDDGKAYPSENNEPIVTEHIEVIDKSKPLKIWVKLENQQWYSSENLNDLASVDPSNIVYYAIETPFGFIGYYVNETDVNFGHAPIIYSPVLDNGTFFKEPVGGMYLKLWVKAGGQWYQKYITDRNLGYDYRQYMQWDVIDSETWQLGFNITAMEISVGATTREFDVYVGIQVNQHDKNAKIKQEVTPYNDYEDIGLEWQCLTAPHFIDTDYELTKIIAENETWSKEIELDNYVDITTEIPNYVKKAYLVSENGVKYHTFDFEDLKSYGLDGSELFRVEEMQMPNGANQYIARIGASKGEGILADEALIIDPEISISDESGYTQITTDNYSVRVSDTGAIPYYWVVNGRNYKTDTTGMSNVMRFSFDGVGAYQGEDVHSFAFTPVIVEDDNDMRTYLRLNYTDTDWGGSGQGVEVFYHFYFYRDFYTVHADYNCLDADFDGLRHYNHYIFYEHDMGTAPKYIWADGDTTDEEGELPSAETTFETSYSNMKDYVYTLYTNNTRTETFNFKLIYDDSGEDDPSSFVLRHRDLGTTSARFWFSGSENGISAAPNYEYAYAIVISDEGASNDIAAVKERPCQFNDYVVDADANHGATMTTGSLTEWDTEEIIYELTASGNAIDMTLDGDPLQFNPSFLIDSFTSATDFYIRINGSDTSWINGTDYFVNLDGSQARVQFLSSINGATQIEMQATSFGGDSTYTLSLHIVEKLTEEDYWYGWVKLANESWNTTAYTQLNSTGNAEFTNLENGSYYLEIYPPEGSGVFGTRIGCTNVSIAGNTTLYYPVYDYRGHIAINWGLYSGATNMTQYILDRMEGMGCQEGDVIQITTGFDYPLDPIDAKWGKSNFRDVIIGLKQMGYLIWYNPRMAYAENYDFWRNLDDYNDTEYSDGDFYNEGHLNDDFRSHNAFMQFEAQMTEIMGDGGDVTETLSSYAFCLVQEDYWDVYDVNDSAYLTYGTGAEEWDFDNSTGGLTIHTSENNHLYEIYYMAGYERMLAPISNVHDYWHWGIDRMLEQVEWFLANCTLPDGTSAIDGLHPDHFGIRALGSWNTWNQGWCSMCSPVVIDWFLGNYTEYASDFKLSWVTYQGDASEFTRGRNDSLPFMHDWLHFRTELLHEAYYKPIFNLAKSYNASVILYDGDDNRMQSPDWFVKLGADIVEHQSGTDFDRNSYYENYADYWVGRLPFMQDSEQNWQLADDHEGFTSQLMRASAEGIMPQILYNHLSPYSYNIPESYYDEFEEAHDFFREIWKTHKQVTEWKIAKVYIMVGASARQTSFYYGGSDGTYLTPQIDAMRLMFKMPVQLEYISLYEIEENGIPDDCDLLIIAGGQDAGYMTYHALYSDTLNTTLTNYVNDNGSIWFFGSIGLYDTDGNALTPDGFSKLLGLEEGSFSASQTADDIFFVDETHWIINDEEGKGLIDGAEGYEPAGTLLGEPVYNALRWTAMTQWRYNVSATGDAADVIVWYGNASYRVPYLYIRDDIASGYVAYCPFESTNIWMGDRLYETLRRTTFFLLGETDELRHVNVTLSSFVGSRTKESLCHYAVYNNSYAWLIDFYYETYGTGSIEARLANSFDVNINFSDFMEAGKDYLIYCYDRPNTTDVDGYHVWDTSTFDETNITLLTDLSGDHIFTKNEVFNMVFEREIAHWFIIKEAVNGSTSLLQVKATNDTVLITNEGAVGDTYVINATAHTNTLGEFVVYCNRTISGVTINGAPVSYSHNITSMILTFNHTFASDADIVINGAVDSTPPSCGSPPSDDTYQEGDTGNSISWTWTESYPDTYNVTRDGVVVDSGSYSDGVPIVLDIDGLTEGTYIFIIGVNDTTGNSASDSVTIIVTAAPSGNGGDGGDGGGAGGGGTGDGDGGDGGTTVIKEMILLALNLIDPREPEIGVICKLYNEELGTQTFRMYVVFTNDYTQQSTQKDARLSILSDAYGQRLFSFRASQGEYTLKVTTYALVNGTEVLYTEQTLDIVVRPGTFFEVFTDFIRYALAALIIDLRSFILCLVNYSFFWQF